MSTYYDRPGQEIQSLASFSYYTPEEEEVDIHEGFAELTALMEMVNESPTLENMTITVKKQREYLGVLSEAAQDVRSRLDKIDRDYEDIREMRQHNEEAYMRLLRRQERIRQKDIEIAQLKAEIEYGMRLYAENEVKLEVKKARAAYLEARIAENGRRKALGLPLLPRDPTRHRT